MMAGRFQVLLGLLAAMTVVMLLLPGLSFPGATVARGGLAGARAQPAGAPALLPMVATGSGTIRPASSTTATATLTVSPASGAVGTPVTYSGQGFPASTTVTVVGPESVVACSYFSSPGGFFNCTSTIPALPQGVYAVEASGGGSQASASLSVLPDLTGLPSEGLPGTNVVFEGFGWNESQVVSVAWNGSSACVARTGTNGTFRCEVFTVPQTSPGLYVVSANDLAAHGDLSASLSFAVESPAPLSASAPWVAPSALDLGQTSVLRVNASGGIGPYQYLWDGLPAGCTTQDTSVLLCTPVATGSFRLGASVTDAQGLSAVSPLSPLEVVARPFVGSLEASRLSADVGEEVNLSVEAVGGLVPFSYSWLGLPPGCTGAGAVISCLPTQPGSYTVSVVLTDASGVSVESNGLYLAIDPPLVVGPVNATGPTTDVFESTAFYAFASGGSGGLHFAWSGLPGGCASSDDPAVNCDPTAAGSYTIGLAVEDSNGARVEAPSLSFVVYTQFFTDNYPTESRITLDLGQSVDFTVTAVGGETPYFYNWSDTPTGCPPIDSWNLTCTPTTVGTWWTSVEVTDATGWWYDTDAVQLIVSSPLEKPSLVAQPGTLPQGSSLTLGVTILGGTKIYTYLWSGLPPGCAPLDQSTLSCAPTTTGTYLVTVTVSDSNGDATSATASVVVTSSVGISSTAIPWATIAQGLVVLVAVVLVVWLLGRRKGRTTEESAPVVEAEVPRVAPRPRAPSPKREFRPRLEQAPPTPEGPEGGVSSGED